MPTIRYIVCVYTNEPPSFRLRSFPPDVMTDEPSDKTREKRRPPSHPPNTTRQWREILEYRFCLFLFYIRTAQHILVTQSTGRLQYTTHISFIPLGKNPLNEKPKLSHHCIVGWIWDYVVVNNDSMRTHAATREYITYSIVAGCVIDARRCCKVVWMMPTAFEFPNDDPTTRRSEVNDPRTWSFLYTGVPCDRMTRSARRSLRFHTRTGRWAKIQRSHIRITVYIQSSSNVA